MFYLKEKKSIKRTLRYFFSISLILWILISIYIGYQYVRSSSKEVISKGGTFVEGIFNTTSYLPYLKNDWQSMFYQGLLFNSCLDYEINKDGNLEFTSEICDVKTDDYKTYYVSLSGDYKRSDGVPLNIADLFFTYNEIIKKNIWNINQLNTYKDIIVLNEDDIQIKIIFPQSSIDNSIFFTNYILPRHALIDDSLANYQQNFSIEPVFSNCGKIKPQTTDPYSLIFDLSKCENTNLGFYQVKNLENFENFSSTIQQSNGSIVDAYVYPQQTDIYITKNIGTTKLMAIFFNTKSEKTRVRLRRALGGLIIDNFFYGDYMNHIKKNEGELFNYFLSKGENIKSFINRISLGSEITKEDLLDIGIKKLDETIQVKGINNRLTFYTENLTGNINLDIGIDKVYDNISIIYNTGKETSPTKYSSKDKIIQISLNPNIIPDGLNKINIYGTIKGKKDTIASMDIYNLTSDNISKSKKPDPKLTVIYYKEPNSIFVVNKLKEIFKKFDIIENFIFEGFDDADQLEGKLTIGNYDIVISNIDVGLKNDIIKLLSIEKPSTNPSQYTNSKMVGLLKDYFAGNTTNTIGQINEIYAQDMPFLILGNTFTKLQLKPNISKQLFSTGYDSVYEYNRRKRIFKNLSLTSNIKIDGENLKNTANFKNFILGNLIK